eukprot:CAMPEP_0113947580 /NCGR_PEP_ID=MMETSP1339-20121228/65582_1 /TAXON_ID=94617 /ORGANISM="Fibrocapsa japonica" /LENGTH=284 /DNA_ID=CAMNT_0000954243 /DNA_START=90 /DNA_END=944 /DNA_ORIENTATION=+ /assembly_acc=CAM_ASM_000762
MAPLQAVIMRTLVVVALAFTPGLAKVGPSSSAFPMSTSPMTQDEAKKVVGYKSVDDYVKSGMVVGLGTGSTAAFAVERLGQKLQSGELRDVVAVPTSVRTRQQAEDLGIPLVTLDTHSELDVAIDGADEVDEDLNLVKGRGGALLREKMVEVCAKKFIVIVDDSKLVRGLGVSGAMPVEVTPFCWKHSMDRLLNAKSMKGCTAELRMDGDKPYVTDNDNYIIDLYFKEPMKDANAAAKEMLDMVGIVEHGLFLDMTTAVLIAGKDGSISVKEAQMNKNKSRKQK